MAKARVVVVVVGVGVGDERQGDGNKSGEKTKGNSIENLLLMHKFKTSK